eukprot:TRINITY_DN2543_c0_g2_i1.p1 TRINITY_DN2543_c0_g2~~TRINITY_DN2543_c0_g2_i1.p1  ORF type:complete len:2286 (-),score=503.70 TRINITY_DN2543_c0_g2_i1:137-6166(-)
MAHEGNTPIVTLYEMHLEQATLGEGRKIILSSSSSGSQIGSTMAANSAGGGSGSSMVLVPPSERKLKRDGSAGSLGPRGTLTKRSSMSLLITPSSIAPAMGGGSSIGSDHHMIAAKGADHGGSSGPSRARGHSPNNSAQTFSILLDLKLSMCQVGEPSELYFSLYSSSEGSVVTEQFRVLLTEHGLPADIDAIGNIKAFFEVSELYSGDLYLYCRMMRKGALIAEEEKKPQSKNQSGSKQDAQQGWRRPFAGCVLNLSIAALTVGKEIEMPMKMCAPRDESAFNVLPDLIIKNNAAALSSTPKGNLTIGVTLYAGSVQQVKRAHDELRRYPTVKSLDFPTAWEATAPRNDFYVTLDSASIAADSKSEKTAELSLIVRDEEGHKVDGALSFGPGDKAMSEYTSCVFVRNVSPQWKETIRINIPPEQYSRYHLHFTLRTAHPKKAAKVFSFGFLRLANADRTVIRDGTHDICTYKPRSVASQEERTFYLRPSSDGPKLTTRKGENIKVNVRLRSTNVTQNASMLALMQWNRHSSEVASILADFQAVGVLEIIKFLKETFNALFGIVISDVCKSSAELLSTACGTIIRVVELVSEQNKDLLDMYIKSFLPATEKDAAMSDDLPLPSPSLVGSHKMQLVFASLHGPLLKALHNYIKSNMSHHSQTVGLRKTGGGGLISALRVLDSMMNFITGSRKHQERLSESDSHHSSHEAFKESILQLFEELNLLMSITDAVFIPAQTAAVQSFGRSIEHLKGFFNNFELSKVACDFINAMQNGPGAASLNVEKLILISSLLISNMSDDDEGRAKLIPVINEQLKYSIVSERTIEEQNECINVIFLLLLQIQTTLKGRMDVSNAGLVSLVPDILRAIEDDLAPSLRDPDGILQQGLIVCLTGILHLMQATHYRELLASSSPSSKFTTEASKRAFLRNLFFRLRECIRPMGAKGGGAFPGNWFGMQMFLHKTLFSLLRVFASDILLPRVRMLSDLHAASAGTSWVSTTARQTISSPQQQQGTTTGPPISSPLASSSGGVAKAAASAPRPLSKRASVILRSNVINTAASMTDGNSSLPQSQSTSLSDSGSHNVHYRGTISHSQQHTTENASFAPVARSTHIYSASAPVQRPHSPSVVIRQQQQKAATQEKAALQSGSKETDNKETDKELDVFEAFFVLLVTFLTSPVVTLEQFAASKQMLILERYEDMRLPMLDVFTSLWTALDAHQTKFISALIGLFLELSMVQEEHIKSAGLELYYTTLTGEYKAQGTFRGVETQTIDALDRLVNRAAAPITGFGGDGHATTSLEQLPTTARSFQRHFKSTLRSKFENETDPAITADGLAFTSEMQKLLSLLLALQALPKNHHDERIQAILAILQYLKQTDRVHKYIKYVHELSDEHLAGKSNTEAALALLLHAELLDWSDTLVEPMGPFVTKERAWERKEKLYLSAIECLDKDKYWEKAIDLYDELRAQYQRVLYDFNKLADILAQQSRMFSSIAKEQRFFAEYYHVGFWGKGFPVGLQNKQFIYRGYELEHAADFQARITALYPKAQLLSYTEAPGDDIKNGPQQTLQIFAVRSTQTEGEALLAESMPRYIQKFLLLNDVRYFVYSKPFRMNKTKNKENEFEDLWIRRIRYETRELLPNIMRRSEVIDATVSEISPIQNAVNALAAKIRDLKDLFDQYDTPDAAAAPYGSINPLTMQLNGVIDAAVSGGIGKYQRAFLTPSFAHSNPDDVPLTFELKKLIIAQIDVLARGLEIHGKLCKHDLIGLQKQLETKLDELMHDTNQYRPLVGAPPAKRPPRSSYVPVSASTHTAETTTTTYTTPTSLTAPSSSNASPTATTTTTSPTTSTPTAVTPTSTPPPSSPVVASRMLPTSTGDSTTPSQTGASSFGGGSPLNTRKRLSVAFSATSIVSHSPSPTSTSANSNNNSYLLKEVRDDASILAIPNATGDNIEASVRDLMQERNEKKRASLVAAGGSNPERRLSFTLPSSPLPRRGSNEGSGITTATTTSQQPHPLSTNTKPS